jgi:hypothetical protein
MKGHTVMAQNRANDGDTPCQYKNSAGFADWEALGEQTNQGKTNDVANTVSQDYQPSNRANFQT